MTSSLTVEQVLTDIELALLQGSIPRSDLVDSIQSIRRFANASRGELLDPQRQKPDYAALATRTFQLDDMLLALLQEMARQLAAQELELRKSVSYLAQHAPNEAPPGAAPLIGLAVAAPSGAGGGAPVDAGDADWAEAAAELEGAMQLDALELRLAMHDEGKGAFAGVTRPLRTSFHSLALYYVNQLADRQAAINRLYGDRILALHEEGQVLAAAIRTLEHRLAALETNAPPQQAT